MEAMREIQNGWQYPISFTSRVTGLSISCRCDRTWPTESWRADSHVCWNRNFLRPRFTIGLGADLDGSKNHLIQNIVQHSVRLGQLVDALLWINQQFRCCSKCRLFLGRTRSIEMLQILWNFDCGGCRFGSHKFGGLHLFFFCCLRGCLCSNVSTD